MQELHDSPRLRVGEIAEKLAIHPTTASNLLDALRKRGFVIKQRDSDDQCIVTLVSSSEGAALLKKAPTPARSLLPEPLRRMDKKCLADLNKGLQTLISVIDLGDETFGLQPLPFTM